MTALEEKVNGWKFVIFISRKMNGRSGSHEKSSETRQPHMDGLDIKDRQQPSLSYTLSTYYGGIWDSLDWLIRIKSSCRRSQIQWANRREVKWQLCSLQPFFHMYGVSTLVVAWPSDRTVGALASGSKWLTHTVWIGSKPQDLSCLRLPLSHQTQRCKWSLSLDLHLVRIRSGTVALRHHSVRRHPAIHTGWVWLLESL